MAAHNKTVRKIEEDYKRACEIFDDVTFQMENAGKLMWTISWRRYQNRECGQMVVDLFTQAAFTAVFRSEGREINIRLD